MARHNAGKLGEILLATSLITTRELDEAIGAQSRTGKRLGQILIDQGAATEDDIAWALSNQLMYPYVFLSQELIDQEAVRLLPEPFLRERHVLPIHRFGQQLTLAMADPTDDRTVEEVSVRTGLQVNRAVALQSNIEDMLRRLPGRQAKAGGGNRSPQGQERQYLQFHLAHALQEGASEIYFDPPDGDGAEPAAPRDGNGAGERAPGEGRYRVRYRLHGVLVDRAGHPGRVHAALLRHLREFAALPDTPAATGSVPVRAGGIDAHAVVSVVPGAGGPSAAIALYPYRAGRPDLLPLGVDRRMTDILQALVAEPRGCLLVGCADPGLRAALLRGVLPEGGEHTIWSLERLPIYRHAGVIATPADAGGQTAFLLAGGFSAHVDVVAVDDAGDAATLRAGLECARTRSVVLGHPADDLPAVMLQAMEAAGAALATSTLTAVVAARKIRLLCPECKERLRRALGAAAPQTFTPHGCAACGFTGFRGARALAAAWVVGAEDRRCLRGRGREAGLRRVAEAAWDALLSQGEALLDDGLTSMGELSRVLRTEGV